LRSSASPALDAQEELRNEIALLFKTAVVDRSMAMARARRLLEVMIVDYYIRWKPVTPPYRNKIKILYNLIEELGAQDGLSQTAVSLCHAVRLEGNRVLHYSPVYPGEPKWAEVGDHTLTSTLFKILELAEKIGTGGHSVYLASLPAPFAILYKRLNREWKPNLELRRERRFPLFEALDLLFRSIVAAMKPEWLTVLEKYASDGVLPESLPRYEEEALRQLRNLGLIQHDGSSLFTPTRSHKVWPAPPGRVFLALSEQTAPAEAESVAREVVQRLGQVLNDQAAIDFLARVSEARSLAQGEKPLARRLRNLSLVRHETYFLEGATSLVLTDLGYYVLGKSSPE
jgi:hypothetical protein